MTTIRVLTVTDLHQSRALGEALVRAVQTHEPDVLAVVGDTLDFSGRRGSQFITPEVSQFLAELPVKELVFCRGNHDAEDWPIFVETWPHEHRPLILLHGTAHVVGPLVVVGFPCDTGWDRPWRETLPKVGNVATLDHTQSGRKSLTANPWRWLRPLLRQHGPAARTLWLLHEPPMTQPIAHPMTCNPDWFRMVSAHQPLLCVSGHDHHTPARNGVWHARVGHSVCLNVGQGVETLHYSLLEFTFPSDAPCVPTRVLVRAFPSGEQLDINPVQLVP